MLTVEENERVTRVGPGTPLGKLFRRYWWPACLSKELPDPDGARHAYILQMRVGCPYDNSRNAKEKTWVSYYLTNLWFDPLMEDCARDPEPKVKS